MMIENATKRKPIFIGKPNKFIVDICLEKYNYSPEETLIIGNRLYTDILCGMNMDIDTCLVLSGEADENDLNKSKYRPTFVFNSIQDLYDNLKRGK